MKTPIAIAACLAAAFLAGCESDDLLTGLHSVLAPREAPRTHVFQAEQRATYEAARAAAVEMGYRITRGGPAEGTIDALSGISGADPSGGSRQMSMKVRMSSAAESGTSVSVSFMEIIEADTANRPGMATETPLRDPGLYEVFFSKVQGALQARPKE
jgi:hypothetical protein